MKSTNPLVGETIKEIDRLKSELKHEQDRSEYYRTTWQKCCQHRAQLLSALELCAKHLEDVTGADHRPGSDSAAVIAEARLALIGAPRTTLVIKHE